MSPDPASRLLRPDPTFLLLIRWLAYAGVPTNPPGTKIAASDGDFAMGPGRSQVIAFCKRSHTDFELLATSSWDERVLALKVPLERQERAEGTRGHRHLSRCDSLRQLFTPKTKLATSAVT
jgi:hypothetical protein